MVDFSYHCAMLMDALALHAISLAVQCCCLFPASHATDVLQVNGHFIAKLDPLGIDQRPMPVELDLALYGFSDKDMDRE